MPDCFAAITWHAVLCHTALLQPEYFNSQR